METNITSLSSRTRNKELLFKIVLLSSLTIGTYSNVKKLRAPKQPIKINNIYNDVYGNFDRASIPNNPHVIAKMVSVLRPEFSSTQREGVAVKIHQALGKHKITPQIVVAIIDIESNFNQELVSSTGDLSMAQVNVEVWNKEFMRMNLELIDVEKLKIDESYSLEIMVQILHILKTRYEKTDRRWYARYHSKTKKYKKAYLAKLESRLKLLEKSKYNGASSIHQPLVASI